MYNPIATYRIQFHAGFTLADLDRIIPYLAKLGIGAVYASPIFDAIPGSTHGYDITNPHHINPEIGTEDQLRTVAQKLKSAGIGWIQDIVPNHMAYDPRNVWLMDVLEKGRYSPYAGFFDVAWSGDLFQGRLLAPFLSEPVAEALASQALTIVYRDSRLNLLYGDLCFPLHPRSYEHILALLPAPTALKQFAAQIADLHAIEEAVAYTLRWHELILQLEGLMKQPATGEFIRECLAVANDDPSFLRAIVDEQVYNLSPWQITDRHISFRRFFTVNGLIGLNMQDEKVFNHYHAYVAKLVADGVFDGLRVDHVDGLYDPEVYVHRLRALAGRETYIVVEKILQAEEQLPAWPVQGTTGYEFLGCVNQLLTCSSCVAAFTEFYRRYTADTMSVEEALPEKKAVILFKHMSGELDNLSSLFMKLNLIPESAWEEITPDMFKACLAAWLIRFPTYRYYGNSLPLPPHEAESVRSILKSLHTVHPELRRAFYWLAEALLGARVHDEDHAQRAASFYQRCMQFTGPLMAKGMEDTLMYTYGRFIAHNEVGDTPAIFGMGAQAFHAGMIRRHGAFPLSLNATSTHDTKRGEDVRARLQVLSGLPTEWMRAVATLSAALPGELPDAGDRYFLYQTIVGAWPTHEDAFADRLKDYVVKMLREGKRHSDWNRPDVAYESAVQAFVDALLASPAAVTLRSLVDRLQHFASVHTLVQVLLKFTCPGVPDVYQGCESWDYSLVDPDNRRPVDFASLGEQLEIVDPCASLALAWAKHPTLAKLYLVKFLFTLRKATADHWATAEYVPLRVEGRHSDHILAYARRTEHTWFVTIVPLHLATITSQDGNAYGVDWHDTAVLLPAESPSQFYNLFTHQAGHHNGKCLVKEIFASIPLALLRLTSEKKRRAGILLHITSLPSLFAIGDLGPQAYAFATLLERCHQTVWQMLPLNPTHSASGYSPYSAYSALAGNSLLISPERLVAEDWLTATDVEAHRETTVGQVDFAKAQRQKEKLLTLAWANFADSANEQARGAYVRFAEREAWWLNDFVLYDALARHHGPAWVHWPKPYRTREAAALDEFTERHRDLIEQAKWQQFCFDRQWRELKMFCNAKGIHLLGDVPFYIGRDSADVWAHPELFCLTSEGGVAWAAGVPPDYFNSEGQLWGMPVFDWDALAATRYAWWIQRMDRNMEYFDTVRLDHFRAFAAYWSVEGNARTARDGEWRPGPGAAFFDELLCVSGALSLVAEDLGEITPDVYALRDAYGLPGMKVLQFAFGNATPQSPYIPHNFEHDNFVAYTGTHDNNTTLGWYRRDLDNAGRVMLERYVGHEITEATATQALMRMAYASVARMAIVPLQDVLNLGEHARLNTPGTPTGNWQWRWNGELPQETEKLLREWTALFNR